MDSKVWMENNAIAKQYSHFESVTGDFGSDLIKLSVKGKGPFNILDNACGTGIVTAKLYEIFGSDGLEGSKITCADIAPPMVAATEARAKANDWTIVTTQVADATKTGLPDSTYSHVITNFGIMFLPPGTPALKEMYRMLKPGGVAAASTWIQLDWINDMREAMKAAGLPAIPDTVNVRKGLFKGDWWDPEWVKNEFRNAGFTNIETHAVQKDNIAEDTVKYTQNGGPMIANIVSSGFWTAEEKEKYGDQIAPAWQKFMLEKYGPNGFTTSFEALFTIAVKET